MLFASAPNQNGPVPAWSRKVMSLPAGMASSGSSGFLARDRGAQRGREHKDAQAAGTDHAGTCRYQPGSSTVNDWAMQIAGESSSFLRAIALALVLAAA